VRLASGMRRSLVADAARSNIFYVTCQYGKSS
jgi:hypothetical protein